MLAAFGWRAVAGVAAPLRRVFDRLRRQYRGAWVASRLQLARVAAPRLAVAAELPLQKELLRREQMPQALGPQRGLARALELQLRSRTQLVLAMARVMLTQLLERARVKQLEQVSVRPRMSLWPMKMRRQAQAKAKVSQ